MAHDDTTERIIDLIFGDDTTQEGGVERLEREVSDSIKRIDGRLAPLARRTPSHLLAPRYRISIMGWVDAAQWDAALEDEPEWAHAAYMLNLNMVMDAHGIAVMLLAVGADGLRAVLDALFDHDPTRMRWCWYRGADDRHLSGPAGATPLTDLLGLFSDDLVACDAR